MFYPKPALQTGDEKMQRRGFSEESDHATMWELSDLLS